MNTYASTSPSKHNHHDTRQMMATWKATGIVPDSDEEDDASSQTTTNSEEYSGLNDIHIKWEKIFGIAPPSHFGEKKEDVLSFAPQEADEFEPIYAEETSSMTTDALSRQLMAEDSSLSITPESSSMTTDALSQQLITEDSSLPVTPEPNSMTTDALSQQLITENLPLPITPEPKSMTTDALSQQLITENTSLPITPSWKPAQNDATSDLITELITESGAKQDSQIPSFSKPVVTIQIPSKPINTTEEEISQSYTSLSLTSSLSDIASSQISALRSSPARVNTPVPEAIPAPTYDLFSNLEVGSNYESGKRRSLRPRTQAQLHPYLLDAIRHRREFRNGGLRPLRVEEAEEMARKSNHKPDHDTEFEGGEDSQNTVIEEDGQIASTIDDLPSPSVISSGHMSEFDCRLSPLPSNFRRARYIEEGEEFPDIMVLVQPHRLFTGAKGTRKSGHVSEFDYRLQPLPSNLNTARDSSEDEEFPDITDLVKQARNRFTGAKGTRKSGPKRTYGNIHSRRKHDQLVSSAAQAPSSTILDVFDGPQSPPMTSSPAPPFANWTGDMLRTPSLPDSDMDSESATNIHVGEKPSQITDLPTPAMSSIKRPARIPTEVNMGDKDPFTSCSEVDEPQSLPPKRSVKTRNLLHGVLPASHARLIQRKQERQPNIPRAILARDSRILSPIRPGVRRVVALPRTHTETVPEAPADPRAGLYFLSDESDDDDFGINGVVRESSVESQSLFSQSDFGFAIEDDVIDRMLPSPKRQRTFVSEAGISKKRRIAPSLFKNSHGGPFYQARGNGQSLVSKVAEKIESLRRRPFQLSMQQAMPQFNDPVARLPKFVRVAARNAGSRHALESQGPAPKIIQLDNREDTVDVQAALREWKFNPSRRWTPAHSSRPRPPLHIISGNSKNRMTRPQSDNFKRPVGSRVVLKRARPNPAVCVMNRQTRIPSNPRLGTKPKLRHKKPRVIYLKADATWQGPRPISPRFAQLEISEADYFKENPQAAFRSVKRTLDESYMRNHNGLETNILLARFLADGDCIGNTAETSRPPVAPVDRVKTANYMNNDTTQCSCQRKRLPKQLDATAAKYRQPNEPMIFASIDTPITSETLAHDAGKIYGLGASDAQYTIDFDVFPLRFGVYFHESTFIGKGRLVKAVRTEAFRYDDHPRGCSSARFGSQYIKWGMWNTAVSSQMGTCFDWIITRLHHFVSTSSDIVKKDVDKEIVECMLFLVEYFQDTLTFPSRSEVEDCLARMLELMQELRECLEYVANNLDSQDDLNCKRILELSVFELVLVFQALRISTTHIGNVSEPTTQELEALLIRTAKTCGKLLFIIGLSSIQSMYDDLQYLSYREAGIRSDQFPAQAWVILIHILRAAQIPHISFWDTVNLQLTGRVENTTFGRDARVMEKLWHSIFSLIPLMEFDAAGILVPRSRYHTTSENWRLIRPMAKRVLQLYALEPQPSPSLTNYCRAIFVRCHYLINAWGWRHQSLIVGPFFDFFWSHELSYTENERTYTAPEFLSDLDGGLSSYIESEDHWLNIFLKIVHSAVKQLRAAGDRKEIRNVVGRLLPSIDLERDNRRFTDIDSLRNLHDLISILYWADSPGMDRSLGKKLDLIERRLPKKEAYMRNVRGQRKAIIDDEST